MKYWSNVPCHDRGSTRFYRSRGRARLTRISYARCANDVCLVVEGSAPGIRQIDKPCWNLRYIQNGTISSRMTIRMGIMFINIIPVTNLSLDAFESEFVCAFAPNGQQYRIESCVCKHNCQLPNQPAVIGCPSESIGYIHWVCGNSLALLHSPYRFKTAGSPGLNQINSWCGGVN
jgi:hypothetical protein